MTSTPTEPPEEWVPKHVETFGNFVSQRHCLYVGWVCGAALRAGARVEPIADADGNWTDRCRVTLAGSTMFPPLTIEFIIPEPPEDWSPE